ncbi:hypothetical protein J8F10_18500 [Gemmata sp. G18]|uniref:Uncharacterized protein n=1 Tax=Gemmata palustris TaxID=2822762 RepID=A0ABS5BU68_9BACT|nr:hypothetical protein [Gemmata palustris]MBP3957256.1 hypothetical protein [Gemmata palustris]
MEFASIIFLVLSPGAPADKAEAVVAQKSRMPNRYQLKLRVESRTPNAPPPLESSWDSTLHIWRDGNKFRVDHLDAHYTPPRPNHDSHDRRVTCENCEKEGYGIVTTVVRGSPPTLHTVEFVRLGTRNLDGYCTYFDWRYFGLSNDRPCGYPKLHIGSDFPGFFGRSDVQTRRENRGGVPCLVAAMSRKTGHLQQSVWLSEREEFNPVFFEDKFEVVGGEPESRTTEVSWQLTPGGHRYPKTVKHNTTISFNGAKYPGEEIVTVTHADFDSAIDPAVFTLAGLGLNENQAIGLPDLKPSERPLWRNGKVDESYTLGQYTADMLGPQTAVADGPKTVANYPAEGSTTLTVSIVTALLAVVTAVLAVVIRRRRAAG